jgi:hypothetical protein
MSRSTLALLMLGLSLIPIHCWAAEPNPESKATSEIEIDLELQSLGLSDGVANRLSNCQDVKLPQKHIGAVSVLDPGKTKTVLECARNDHYSNLENIPPTIRLVSGKECELPSLSGSVYHTTICATVSPDRRSITMVYKRCLKDGTVDVPPVSSEVPVGSQVLINSTRMSTWRTYKRSGFLGGVADCLWPNRQLAEDTLYVIFTPRVALKQGGSNPPSPASSRHLPTP